MAAKTKKAVLDELESLISTIKSLANSRPGSAQHTRWLLHAMEFVKEVFGCNSAYFVNLRSLNWCYSGPMVMTVDDVMRPGTTRERFDAYAFVNALDTAQGILLAACDDLRGKELKDVYRGKDTGPEASVIVRIIKLVEQKLRKLFRDSPSSEAQVQDELEKLFIAADIPYSREAVTIEYSSKTYKPDFTVDRADLAIDVKFCGKLGREKEMIGEINDDILAYTTKYGNLLFVVYDCGFIRDIDRFAANFEEQSAVIVRVVKH